MNDSLLHRERAYLATAVTLLALMISSAFSCAFAARTVELTLSHDGLEREYLLYSPPSRPADSDAIPLLLVLHGGGGTHRGMVRLTKSRFHQLADRDGFLVVYPQGIGKGWNEGRDDPISEAHRRDIDDVGFFRALIEDLVSKHSIDSNRVFVTGISNGGLMSFRLACSLPDKIRGIAPVTASIPSAILPLCQSESTVSLAVFNGTKDPLVPYYGGQIRLFRRQRGEVLSTDETIQVWLNKNRCTLEPEVTALPNLTKDGTRITKTEYTQCSGESKVVLFRIDGGGHTWPGGRQYLPALLVGRTSRDINACDEIWTFFQSLNWDLANRRE
jgi:polyhydroxybutyrate depolymerase